MCSHNVCGWRWAGLRGLNTHISTQQERESNSNSNDDDDDDKACMHVFRSCKRKYFFGVTATAMVCVFCKGSEREAKGERKAGQRYSGGKTHDDSAHHVDDGDGVDNNIWT